MHFSYFNWRLWETRRHRPVSLSSAMTKQSLCVAPQGNGMSPFHCLVCVSVHLSSEVKLVQQSVWTSSLFYVLFLRDGCNQNDNNNNNDNLNENITTSICYASVVKLLYTNVYFCKYFNFLQNVKQEVDVWLILCSRRGWPPTEIIYVFLFCIETTQ